MLLLLWLLMDHLGCLHMLLWLSHKTSNRFTMIHGRGLHWWLIWLIVHLSYFRRTRWSSLLLQLAIRIAIHLHVMLYSWFDWRVLHLTLCTSWRPNHINRMMVLIISCCCVSFFKWPTEIRSCAWRTARWFMSRVFVPQLLQVLLYAFF